MSGINHMRRIEKVTVEKLLLAINDPTEENILSLGDIHPYSLDYALHMVTIHSVDSMQKLVDVAVRSPERDPVDNSYSSMMSYSYAYFNVALDLIIESN